MSSDIQIRNVGKSYATGGADARKVVLQHLNLTIHAGELVALVGPSGCGKSTLLNLVAGLEQPSAGAVSFDRARDAVNLGVVFQQPRLLEWLSVSDNVRIVLERSHRDDEARQRVRTLLGQVELAEHSDSYPQFLSGGQKQRVSIARAFAVQPDVLLLDEPFSALDELTARRLRELLQSLWMHGAQARPTGLLVTHNMLEAAFLADRIFVMGGQPTEIKRIVEVDVPRPRHPDDPALFDIHRQVMDAMRE